MSLRFPAEWEPQDAVLIAWPHAGTDWAERLAEVETTYVALGEAITRFQRLVIVVADAALEIHARALLADGGADLTRVRFVHAAYDDTWLRDSGPITLRDGEGFRLLDFRFTGWGGKYGAAQDDALIAQLVAAGLFKDAKHQRIDFALEGGGIETDGDGTLLTTWHCLHERHPGLTRQEIRWQLENALQQQRAGASQHVARGIPGAAGVHAHQRGRQENASGQQVGQLRQVVQPLRDAQHPAGGGAARGGTGRGGAGQRARESDLVSSL